MEPRPASTPLVLTVIGSSVPSKGVGLHSSLAAGAPPTSTREIQQKQRDWSSGEASELTAPVAPFG
jgi:hypothetical protein